MHVDDFIDTHFMKDTYARWVLNYFRHSAALKNDFWPYMKDHKLFCTYDGTRYRCTGASRLGDVWLTTRFEKILGYDIRVDVAECTEWSPYPQFNEVAEKESEEGDDCSELNCPGAFELIREGDCSCHINPPCSACVDAPLTCNECGYKPADED